MNRIICKTLKSLHLINSLRINKQPILSSISLLFFSSSSSSSYNLKREKSKVDLAEAASAASAASSLKFNRNDTENSDSVVSFLKENGFSNTHIEKMVAKSPRILLINLDKTLKPKIKIFQEFGFPPTDIVDIISSYPSILHRSAENQLQRSILILKDLLGSNVSVHKALKASGWFLTNNLDKTLIPSIEFLKSCGVTSSQIGKYVFTYSSFFLNRPERVKYFVQRVDEIGFDRKSKMFLPAIRTISTTSTEKWEFKLNVFRSLGFSEGDILSMFRSMPLIFTVSESKIKEIAKMLLCREDVDICAMVKNPSLFLCSIENCLKPRLRVYDTLTSKNLLRHKFGVATICKWPKRKFIEKFVLPYQEELGDISFLLKPQC